MMSSLQGCRTRFLQAALGGLRWLEATRLAEVFAARAIEEGDISAGVRTRKAFGLGVREEERRNGAVKVKSMRERKATGRSVVADHVKRGTAVDHSDGKEQRRKQQPQLMSSPQRLVTYDVLDCTFGDGSSSLAVLNAGGPISRVVAMDCDPATAVHAEDVADEFGPHRFKFFCAKMSDALGMFGESSFDCILVDNGPNSHQLNDPSRGFELDDEDHPNALDMRYGAHMQQSALDYLNHCSRSEMTESIASYGLLSFQESAKICRVVAKCRPYYGSQDVVSVVCSASQSELSEGLWAEPFSPMTHHLQSTMLAGTKKLTAADRFLSSLRGVVNHERQEMRSALESAFVMLRVGGRLVVRARLPWEAKLVEEVCASQPYGILQYHEPVYGVPTDIDVVHGGGDSTSRLDSSPSEWCTPLSTNFRQQWYVAARTRKSSFVIKNFADGATTPEALERSATEWVLGAVGGQTRGFPAANFTFPDLSASEKKALKRNAQPPPFDHDTDHWENPRRGVKQD